MTPGRLLLAQASQLDRQEQAIAQWLGRLPRAA
jgi:hypothetical protein